MIRFFPLASVFLFLTLLSWAQMPGYLPETPFFSTTDSGKIYVSIKGTNFFKNNEYFNPIEEGYTLLGFYGEPSLILQLSENTRMQVGAGFLKYSGRNGFYQVEPMFRFQYQPVQWFQMILGNLYGGSNHQIVEPLYRWELNFSQPMESGLQFLFNTKRANADIWLNWEKFILHGDPFQEELTVGVTSDFFLTDKNSDITLSFPVQTLFRHHGGQINSIELPLETLANWAGGIKVRKTINRKFFHFWEANFYYLGYSDLSPQKLQRYRNGYGLYPKAKVGFSNFTTEIGYFHGNRFVSPMGERLFHSSTIPLTNSAWGTKNLCTSKFWFVKKIKNGISLGTYFESYTDINNRKTDYSYGVHIMFHNDFFLFKYR